MREIITQTLLGGIIGGGVVLTFLTFLLQKGRLSSLLKANLLNFETLSHLMQQINWKEELNPIIDEQLDALTDSIKQKNAMIGMFLTPAIADPLKEEGKTKLLEMVPKAQEKLARSLCKDETAEKLEAFLKKWLKEKMLLFVSSAFLLGAGFGFIAGLFLSRI